jgi:cellulase/cellobiase CelA1
VKDLIARATPSTAPVAQAPVELDNVDALVSVTSAWWGGFQGEIKVTAKAAVADWDVLLGTKWNVQNVWGAVKGEVTATAGGVLVDLNDADWNGTLAAGQTATIGFTALTGVDAVLGSQQILDGIWIG